MEAAKITGFTLYAVPVDDSFNYAMPIATLGPTLRSVTVDVQTNMELKFVMRAFLETGSMTYYSPDSQPEVRHAVVIAPFNVRRE